MRRVNLLCVLGLLAFLGCVFGCDADAPTPPQLPDEPVYHQLTAPESLLANLELSYNRREIQEYMHLLAPEFTFKFQPLDAITFGSDYLTHDQDSTDTRALLTTGEVFSIRLTLIPGGRDPSIDTEAPVDSIKIRILTTDLQVDQKDGLTWFVSDQQDFFFRQGKAALGEDPTHWFIYEWIDIPTLHASGLPVVASTWGAMKVLYTS